MSVWEKWRPWLQREKQLLLELALMLLVALVVGVYFLEHFSARLLGATIGAELSGVRLGPDLADEVIAEIRQALLDYKVIVFRDQAHLRAEDQVAFASRFGDLEVHPFLRSSDERPELVRFEKSPEFGGYENSWHSDVSWREMPSLGAVLRAVEVPASGGDTLFCDMYAAFASLDEATQERLRGLTATHDYSQVFGHIVPDDEKEAMREAYPEVQHPVVRTHPETGRELLYVNGVFVSRIDDLPAAGSRELLDALISVPATPEFQCRHRWEAGDVVFWDNRATQHYAASDYWPARRVMERASIVGDRPF